MQLSLSSVGYGCRKQDFPAAPNVQLCNEGMKTMAADLAKTILGLKPGTKKHKAAHMYLRTKGATNMEVVKALEGPHLNLLKEVEAKGHGVQRNKTRVDGKLVTNYRIVLKGNPGKGSAATRKAREVEALPKASKTAKKAPARKAPTGKASTA